MTKEEQEKIAMQDTINENGAQIIDVVGDNYIPPFSYTIGLYKEFNHPEIICFGLSSEMLQALLTIAKDKVEEGLILEAGKSYKGFLEKDIEVYFLPVDKAYFKDYLNYGSWFYEGDNFKVLQMVWPDKRGNFPWQNQFNKELEFAQPLLDRSLDFKFYESRKLGVFTTQSVLEAKETIKYVIHDEEGDWFFLENDQVENDDILMADLETIVKLDPTVNSIYYLQYGWEASRDKQDEEWTEVESEWEEDDEEENE